MRYEDRSDSELLELAQAGWRPAFAVLVHRHAPALLTAFADAPDPAERTYDVLLRAMRQLPEHDLSQSPRQWFFALAGRPVPARTAAPVDATIDRIWRDLDARWPDGRRTTVRRARVVRPLLTVLGAIAVGVVVPTIALGLPTTDEDEPERVRAEPLAEEPIDTEPEDLPDFEFPHVDTTSPPTVPPDPVAPPATDTPSPPPPPVVVPSPGPTGDPDDGSGPADPTDPTPVDPGLPVDPPSDDGGTTDGGDGGDDTSDDGTTDGEGDGGASGGILGLVTRDDGA